MTDLNNISKDICKSKNLNKNLSLYINNMMTLYSRFSYIKLSMNYYTFNDVIIDSDDEVAAQVTKIYDALKVIINENIVNNDNNGNITNVVTELKALRKDITDTMEIVTAYVDRLAIYEHMLNRCEYKFSDEKLDEDYYDTRFTNDIMNYILSDRDSVVINSKIAEVVGQLPMRLTKNKFFELVRDAMNLYNGQEKSSLNDFIYMLETVSGIYSPEGFHQHFSNIYEILNKLSEYNYKEITKEEFDIARNQLNYAVSYITKTSDLYVQLMELVNDTLVIILSKPYAFGDNTERENCVFVINSVMNSDNMNFTDDIFEDINDKFISFEGKQEKIYEQISSNDYVIDEIEQTFVDIIAQNELTEVFDNLKAMSKLSSGSNFINLEAVKVVGDAVESDIDTAFDKYYTSMTEMFKSGTQIYNRAVMSAVLASLPVFFNNVDEIMNYVNTSLSQCGDIAERKACVSLIRMLIEDSNA